MAARRGGAQGGPSDRETLLDAALDVLAERGAPLLPVGRIAERLGLTVPALLRMFGTREGFLVAVLERRNEVAMRVGFGERSLVDGFVRAIRGNRERPGLVQTFAVLSALGTDADNPAHEHFVAHYEQGRVFFARELGRLQDAGEVRADLDPDLAAAMVMAAADGLQVQWLYDDAIDVAAALEHLWRMLATHPGTAATVAVREVTPADAGASSRT
jgi:AcrR family transcriptional regulator